MGKPTVCHLQEHSEQLEQVTLRRDPGQQTRTGTIDNLRCCVLMNWTSWNNLHYFSKFLLGYAAMESRHSDNVFCSALLDCFRRDNLHDFHPSFWNLPENLTLGLQEGLLPPAFHPSGSFCQCLGGWQCDVDVGCNQAPPVVGLEPCSVLHKGAPLSDRRGSFKRRSSLGGYLGVTRLV